MEGFNKPSDENNQDVAEAADNDRYIEEIEQEGKELMKEGRNSADEIDAAVGLSMLEYRSRSVDETSNGNKAKNVRKRSAKTMMNDDRQSPKLPKMFWGDIIIKQLTEIARRESAAVSLPILIQCRDVLVDYLRRNPRPAA